MKKIDIKENAVLGDIELQEALKGIDPQWADFVTRVAGEAWGLPLIDQKTKALISIALDVVSTNISATGNPYAAHINMAIKQGATLEDIKELLLFISPYVAFAKTASAFGVLNELIDKKNVQF